MPTRPPDLRLVPAAGAAWAVVLLGLHSGPVGGVVGAALAGGLLLGGLLGRRAVLVAAGGCALAAALVVTAHAVMLRGHPVRAAAGAGRRGDPARRRRRRPARTALLRRRPAARCDAGAGARGAACGADRGWAVDRRRPGAADRPGRRLVRAAPRAAGHRRGPARPGHPERPHGGGAEGARSGRATSVAAPWWQTAAGTLRDGLRSAAAVLPEAPAALLPGSRSATPATCLRSCATTSVRPGSAT